MQKALLFSVGIAAWAIVTPAQAAPPDPSPALAALNAAVRPVLLLSGPTRIDRGCAALDKWLAGQAAIAKTPPAGASVDASTWKDSVETTAMVLRNAKKACGAPDKKIKTVGGRVLSADQELTDIGVWLDNLNEQTKPRVLPPAMKSFDTTLRSVWADKRRKNAFKAYTAFNELIGNFTQAPSGVDAARWSKSVATITMQLSEWKHILTPEAPPVDDDLESFDSELGELHEAFYTLVLLLPPAAQ